MRLGSHEICELVEKKLADENGAIHGIARIADGEVTLKIHPVVCSVLETLEEAGLIGLERPTKEGAE